MPAGKGQGAIDIWCNIFTPEGVKKNYLDVEHIRFAFKLFGREDRLVGKTPDQFLREMDAHGVETVCIPTLRLKRFHGEMLQDMKVEEVTPLIRKNPRRFVGLYGIHPFERMDAVRGLERAVEDHGFKGAHIHPYGYGLPVNDPHYYPFYAKCVELDIPIEIQIGHSAELMPSSVGRPILLDDIALYFPELRIIAAHTGWPWVEELVALAWKHPNIYIGTTAHAPRYWDEKLVKFINSRGQNKVLYGTDYPVLNHEETLAQIEAHGFKPEVKRKLLRENAKKVFKL
ncbi:MAG: amidohydrolase [Euryarchaeota archaeon]|nr:amidohydrolase [Euryarchaeota archaeon]